MNEPQINADERRLNAITEVIIASAFSVANELGVGFLEKVYENAMFVDLTHRGVVVEQQKRITVRYHNAIVGEYVADLLVAEEVLVEIKHVSGLDDVHLAQCLNYLKATRLKLCLLINFGTGKVEVRRVVRGL
jgi:GxxExxY protein